MKTSLEREVPNKQTKSYQFNEFSLMIVFPISRRESNSI
ncbi:hypothetical protein VPHD184_0059 [Vibrio phage D184]